MPVKLYIASNLSIQGARGWFHEDSDRLKSSNRERFGGSDTVENEYVDEPRGRPKREQWVENIIRWHCEFCICRDMPARGMSLRSRALKHQFTASLLMGSILSWCKEGNIGYYGSSLMSSRRARRGARSTRQGVHLPSNPPKHPRLPSKLRPTLSLPLPLRSNRRILSTQISPFVALRKTLTHSLLSFSSFSNCSLSFWVGRFI